MMSVADTHSTLPRADGWFPRSIADLDHIDHTILECGKELNADHPGFHDAEYRHRRAKIVDIAVRYRYGQPIPEVEYSEAENKVWELCYAKLRELYPTHACTAFNEILPELHYPTDRIPQLRDVSALLKARTGWTLRPVAGLLTSRDFLHGLAYRVFHSTQYIRHPSKPFYTPEPDVVHELIGHVPLLANKEFADFSQSIGLASLGASEEEVKQLATVYWFSVEFGLCWDTDAHGKKLLHAYGAGLLSSFGELEYCLTGKSELRPFEPGVTCHQPYPITQYQPVYFVADSFVDAELKMLAYSKTLKRSFDVEFEEATESVRVVPKP